MPNTLFFRLYTNQQEQQQQQQPNVVFNMCCNRLT